MVIPQKKPATYQDLCALPEHLVGEIVDGELHASPRPASPHALASSGLGYDITGPFQRGKGGPGGWWILDEPELHLDRDVLVPDLAGWRKERLPVLPREPFFTLAPDWACEVLSPSTRSFDRARKLPKYAAAGVSHAWLVDPDAYSLEVFRRDGDLWVLLGTYVGDEKVRAEPFDAVELALSDLWIPGAPATV